MDKKAEKMEEKPKSNSASEKHQIDFGFSQIDEAEKEERVRHVFDSVAKKYDLMNDLLSLGMHRLWKRRCIASAAVKPGMKVLDIASGTCDLAMAFARLAGDENVTATDINHEMLACGRDRMRAHGMRSNVVLADAERLPFDENSFDVVTVSFGIRNMTHKDRALREMLRVLRPGGKLLVLEFSRCSAFLKPFYDFYSFHFMPWLGGKIVSDAASYRYLAESIRMHPNQQAFAKIMTDAGFSDVKWHNLTFGICALHIGKKN